MGKFAPTAMKLGAIAMATGLFLTACASDTAAPAIDDVSQSEIDAAMSTPTTITFWTWNKLDTQVADFEAEYPEITVNLVNVGSGPDFYTKLRSSMEAGKGAPDVAQIEYHHMPSFILNKSLVDITGIVADDTEEKFADFAWSQVSTDDGLYGIPQDTGPLGLLYRSDLFAAAGITEAPATWADFATAASAIHSADPNQYIANVSPSNASATLGLFAQAGAIPFGYDGAETVTVDLVSDEMLTVAAYLQPLIDQGLISTDPDFTDQWFQGLASGKYASWIAAAWGPLFLQGTAADTSGLWSAAPLPQWAAGDEASGAVGGSANSVISTSKNPIPAAKFAEFINSDPASSLDMATTQFLFPAAKSALADPAFTDQQSEFFGGQEVNKLYSEISPTVGTEFQWLPFMDPVFDAYNGTFGTALTEGTDLAAALQDWQDEVVSYAESQGFTVK